MREQIKLFVNKIASLPIFAKVRRIKVKIKKKVTTSPTYKTFLRKRDEVADCIRLALLAFFDFLGPCWTFLCIKTPDIDETTGISNEIRRIVIQLIMNKPYVKISSITGKESQASSPIHSLMNPARMVQPTQKARALDFFYRDREHQSDLYVAIFSLQ